MSIESDDPKASWQPQVSGGMPSQPGETGPEPQPNPQPSSQPPPGIRNPRGLRTSRSSLDEPRKPANRDWLALERRRLWLNSKTTELRDYPYFKDQPKVPRDHKPGSQENVFVVQLPKRAEAAKQEDAHPPEPNELDKTAHLTLLIYRYTKQADLVNDDMGYGERIIEPYYRRVVAAEKSDPTQLERWIRISQRTKTGRQHLAFIPMSRESDSTAAIRADDPAKAK